MTLKYYDLDFSGQMDINGLEFFKACKLSDITRLDKHVVRWSEDPREWWTGLANEADKTDPHTQKALRWMIKHTKWGKAEAAEAADKDTVPETTETAEKTEKAEKAEKAEKTETTETTETVETAEASKIPDMPGTLKINHQGKTWIFGKASMAFSDLLKASGFTWNKAHTGWCKAI